VGRTVLLDPSVDESEPSTWTLTFSKYGAPVTIEAPIG